MPAHAATGALALAYRCRCGCRDRTAWRDTYSGVNSVGCIPSGACTRALRSPHGVRTGGGGLRGVGRDEPPGDVFAVCDLGCQPDRSGYPAVGLDRVGRLGLGIIGQFESRPACVEKDDPPGPGMGRRALMSRHAADQAGPFGAPRRGPVLASTMGTPGATAAATAAKRSRSSRQPVIL